MKKTPVALLAFLMLLTLGLPVWAAGHSDTVIAYLMEKYDVAAETIELHEGGTLLLELPNPSPGYFPCIFVRPYYRSP